MLTCPDLLEPATESLINKYQDLPLIYPQHIFCHSPRLMQLLRLGLNKVDLCLGLDTNTNLINDIMFTNSFEKYHLERAVSVEPIGETDTALKR